jgi:hypothetical protein
MENHDKDKDESYIRRRNILLEKMKRQQWNDDGDKPLPKKKGPKPKSVVPKVINDPQRKNNKFFKF